MVIDTDTVAVGLGPRRHDNCGAIEEALLPLRVQLVEHPVYDQLRSVPALQIFLHHHSFAVWDFMTLLSALRQRICGSAVPQGYGSAGSWYPPVNSLAARMINEMMLVEESDELPGGDGFASHYELYERGLVEAGGGYETVRPFIRLVAVGRPVEEAFAAAQVPEAARNFVRATLNACTLPTHRLAAYFVFGRENIIPAMFRRIIENIETMFGTSFPTLRYYLDRHVGIDETEHGPASRRMLSALCGEDQLLWREALESAHAALSARVRLWNAVSVAIDTAS